MLMKSKNEISNMMGHNFKNMNKLMWCYNDAVKKISNFCVEVSYKLFTMFKIMTFTLKGII